MSDEEQKKFKPVAKIFDISDYKSSDEAEKGLAAVHEQVSDSYITDALSASDSKQEKKEQT